MTWLIWLLRWLFACTHDRVTWPISGRQCCLNCGAWRTYALEGPQLVRGPWVRGSREPVADIPPPEPAGLELYPVEITCWRD